jgi:cytochrome c biogenesis protein CcmG/thiol:disulfide interchange protein DsbE
VFCQPVRVRKPTITLGSLCLVAAIAIGAVQASDSTVKEDAGPLTRAQVAKPIPGAPAALAALRGRVSELDGGGATAFDAQLRALRGYPVVVNAWASWCDPCEFELPFFQRQAVKRGAKVAFLGVNYRDGRSNAQEMAAKYPLPYPSFRDRDDIVERFKARGLPVTIFFDAGGKRQMVHQGVFASERDLSDAIDRYALK